MLRLSKRLISISLAMIVTVSLSLPTQAYSLIGYKLKGGVGNYNAGTSRYYWYDSANSVVNTQISNINTAISNWVHTGNILYTPIYFKHSSYKPDSEADFYSYYDTSDNANAYTDFYYGSSTSPINPYTMNWSWCRIHINDYFYNYSGYSNNYKQGILAHEFGHVMGLDENNSNSNSIMCQTAYGRNVTTPQLDDLRGINAMYK